LAHRADFLRNKKHGFSAVRASSAVAERKEEPEDEPEVDRVWPAKELRVKDYKLGKGEVAVRFINTMGRFPSDGTNDIIAAAEPGDILLAVADSVGVNLPRGCLTGLCGSCTCDLEDPAAGPGERAILRACSSSVAVPEGCDEMVVDCYRMLTASGKEKVPRARPATPPAPPPGATPARRGVLAVCADAASAPPQVNPMARFSSLDDPKTGFKARWNMPEPGAFSDCAACGAKGVNSKGMMPEDCDLSSGCPFSKN
jgi:ferredoxin